jgi:Bacterial aa3 type cytochrome c oxidase subunit IV
MADYEPGGMDITEQERTFEGFVRWTIRTVIVIIVGLILLAIING